MTLPKPDGLDHYYLIHKPDTAKEVLEQADQCIQDILNGTARVDHIYYQELIQTHSGTSFLPNQIADRYLSRQTVKEFPYEEAVTFCDALRRLVCWDNLGCVLEPYIEKQVQGRYFQEGKKEEGYFYPPCTVLPNLHQEDIYEPLLRFTCYVAVCYTVYGYSCDTLTTSHFFGLVSQLNPGMVKALKNNGTGKLPKDLQRRKTEHMTASANDAFATIRIIAKDHSRESYAQIIDYLCAVLEQEEFPCSYSVEFRGAEKIYLPIPGLPKKGVNQLFACAVQYPELRPAIERYARLAMKEDEWYNNMSDELAAMPGTFAVFALGMEGRSWWPLACDYLNLCDDEHSSLQEKFIHALIQKFGFTAYSIPVLICGVLSMQWLKPTKEFPALMANAESLDALLDAKEHLKDYLPSEEQYSQKDLIQVWKNVCRSIWGKAAEKGGTKVLKSAPDGLKERYEKVFC